MVNETTVPSNDSRDASVVAAQKQGADARYSLQQQVQAQINYIRSIPGGDLPPGTKEKLIGALERALKGGSAASIAAILAEVAREAEAGLAKEALHDVAEIIGLTLNAEEKRRVYARSSYIDLDNERSVFAFADAMVDADVPAEIRGNVVRDVAAMVKSPAMEDTINAYNNASQKAKIIENASMEQASHDLKALKANPALKEVAQEAEITGAKVDREAQKALKAHKKGEISEEKTAEVLNKSSSNMREKTTANVAVAKTIVSPKTRELAEAFGDDRAITDRAIEILKARKHAHQTGKPDPQLTKNDIAVLEVFYVAKEKAIIDRLSENVVARDLEIGMGTQEQRITRAVAVLKNDPTDQFGRVPEARLKSIATSLIVNADEKKLLIDGLDQLTGKAQAGFMLETLRESDWGSSLATAQKHLLTGAAAVFDGNQDAADKAALMTGRGVKNRLAAIGVSAETAQAVGGVVTATLGSTGAAIIHAQHRAADAMESVANTANALQVAWHANEDIAKQVAGLKAKGWGDIVAKDGKKIFNLNGNASHDVAAIKGALEKSGVKLANFDQNKNGSIDEEELRNAMNAVVAQQQAQLKPLDTPQMAAAQKSTSGKGIA